MSTPALAGQWWTQSNAMFPDTTTSTRICDGWAFMLKEMLMGTSLSGSFGGPSVRPAGSKWTMVGSCDGVLGALDGVDRLTGSVSHTYDPTKWLHAASGTAHSWYVLQSPAALGPVYMCVDANSATVQNYGVIFSRNAFVNTPAPATGARPNSNNQWSAGATAEPIPTTNIAVTADFTANAIYRAHLSVDASGAFHYATSRDGAGFWHSYLACFNTTERNANDTQYPTFALFQQIASSPGAGGWATMGSTAAPCTGRTTDGTATQTTGGGSSWSFGGSTAWIGAGTPDMGSSNIRVLPIYIYTLNAGKNCWRGRVPDLWVVGNAQMGDTFPNPQNPTQTVIGTLLVPYYGIPII